MWGRTLSRINKKMSHKKNKKNHVCKVFKVIISHESRTGSKQPCASVKADATRNITHPPPIKIFADILHLASIFFSLRQTRLWSSSYRLALVSYVNKTCFQSSTDNSILEKCNLTLLAKINTLAVGSFLAI